MAILVRAGFDIYARIGQRSEIKVDSPIIQVISLAVNIFQIAHHIISHEAHVFKTNVLFNRTHDLNQWGK